MGSTYLDLTNRLLRRLNEVELTSTNFSSARGLHATAKDAIKDGVKMINNRKPNWPFNASSTSQLLTVGQEEYDWPSDFTTVDWNSFELQGDTALGVSYRSLEPISRELWYKFAKPADDDSTTDGIRPPQAVFPGHGNKFGVTPSPDEAYTILYRYYATPSDLDAYDDEVTIPERFDYVIIHAALDIMNPFKTDMEATDRNEDRLRKGMADMVHQFFPNDDKVYAVQVNRGGGSNYSSGRMWTGY